jgi:streptogramin lyase
MKTTQTTTGQLIRCFLILTWGLLTAPTLHSQSIYSQPYTFTTLAGSAGYGSADGTGASARFWNPYGVVVDSAGNVYVADTSNHTIRKITPGGVVSTLAGWAGFSGGTDGTGANARFNNPYGVALDGAGNLYVADTSNNTIRKVTPGGVVSTLAGVAGISGSADGTGANARFCDPQGVAVDSAGNVYVADTSNYTIRKVTPAGVVSTLAGRAWSAGSTNGTGANARFNYPSGVAVDTSGTVYVADTSNHTIRKITPGGVVSTLSGLAGSWGYADGTSTNARFNHPYGVAVDSTGSLYVADTSGCNLRKITPAGEVGTLAGLAGCAGNAEGTGSAARFSNPAGVAVDSAGSLYVADSANHTIRQVTPAGGVSTLAGVMPGSYGSVDGTGANARFNGPSGVVVDSAGNVYVADSNNQTLRKTTPAGVVSTLAGQTGSTGGADGTGADARFWWPSGLAMDGAGNLYVADTLNFTIRKVTSGGVVSTLAGLAGHLGSADGPGSEARFCYPYGVAVDNAGTVYVADYYNHTIRRITPDGVVSTLAGQAGVLGFSDGAGTNAQFCFPQGVAVDSATNVYVADTYNYTIRKITPDGVVSTLAGVGGYWGYADGTGADARFYNPYGVAVDNAANLYVADYYDYTIRKITPDGVVSTVAGLAGSTGNADGTGADARFYNPSGVAVDSAGNVYVADLSNNTIRFGHVAPAPPLMRIRPSCGQLILSWPLEASNFLVEASSTLFPAPSWIPLTNSVGTNGKSCVLTNSLDTGARFFRLRLP